jgi:alkanesulfonate monooxygenase SsuD/methylene tetrahydromethanopterin reductase-like flavin-dependent oxidoreductase (luciferase family)
MRVYQFTEQPYPDAWENHAGTLRVTYPSNRLDPARAADLFHRYYDEWMLADELGFDVMVNEHHQTATCMSSTVVVALSVLARMTKRARLLVLGYPLGHRTDPLRVAEELATIDVISRGRLDMGFVKGVPYEFACSNQNAVGVMDRFWEAHDFIIKAMTTHDGPFNWERRELPLSPRQHLAASLSAAAPAGVEHYREPYQCPGARRERIRHLGAWVRLQHPCCL